MPRKNKKILFLTRLFYPHIGGVEKHVYKLSQELLKNKFQITVLTEQYDKKLPLRQIVDGIEVIRIPIGSSEKNKKFLIWKWMFTNRKFINEFDIVHAHDVFYWLFVPIGLKKGKKYITFHGYEGFPVKFRHKIGRKIAQRMVAGTVCVGDFIKKWYGIKPNFVTYGAVDRFLMPKKEAKSNSALFFGRLDDLSGIKEYYKAFLRLKKIYPKFKFTVIGEGMYKKKLKNCDISPFKSDISGLISTHKYIFVSGYLSMLEAMSYKKLVFAIYNNELKKDYLISSPFNNLVEICKNEGEIVEKIQFYENNLGQMKKKIQKAYNWARTQSWEKLALEYQGLWKQNK